MIKKEDIENFNTLIKQLNDLQEKIKNYNPSAKINLLMCCDEKENDYCGLFLIDESNKNDNDWLKSVFVTGKKLTDAELYSRSDIKVMINNMEDNNAYCITN